MTDRERLIELVSAVQSTGVKYTHEETACSMGFRENAELADHLLANGIIVPPCKVGQKVYYIFEGEIRELTVTSLSYMFSETFKHLNLHTTNHRGAVLSYEIKDIGKTVFLTKEEAGEKLKELKSNV